MLFLEFDNRYQIITKENVLGKGIDFLCLLKNSIFLKCVIYFTYF